MIDTLYIPDLVGAVVDKVNSTFSSRPTNPFNVYYEYGYHQDVLKILLYKEQNPDKPKKYPFIWLVTPNEVTDEQQGKGGSTTLHFVIVQDTNNAYLMEERKENTIEPVLIPIYDELKRQMRKASNYFTERENPIYKIVHYAKADADGTNLFSDYVDVIDVKWKLLVKNICITS